MEGMEKKNRRKFSVELTDVDISLLEAATGTIIRDNEDIEWGIRILVEKYGGRNDKQKELQQLILILRLQQEVISNPLKKLKIGRHIVYLEEMNSEDVIKGLSERIFEMQYSGQIAHWEKNYLKAIKKIVENFT